MIWRSRDLKISRLSSAFCGDSLWKSPGRSGLGSAAVAIADQTGQERAREWRSRWRWRDGGSGMRTSVRPAAFWSACLFWPSRLVCYCYCFWQCGCCSEFHTPFTIFHIPYSIFHLDHLHLLFASQRRCHWHDTCINILTACRLRSSLFCIVFSRFFLPLIKQRSACAKKAKNGIERACPNWGLD